MTLAPHSPFARYLPDPSRDASGAREIILPVPVHLDNLNPAPGFGRVHHLPVFEVYSHVAGTPVKEKPDRLF